jgi:hypothetical protein
MLGTLGWAARALLAVGGPVDSVDDDRVRDTAGADCRDGPLSPLAPAGRATRSARVGRGADPVVSGRHDRGRSTTLLADSRAGELAASCPGRGRLTRGRAWRQAALGAACAGSAASLAANVAVAQPTVAGRVIAAWPSFALIGAYELLMRQIRRKAAGRGKLQHAKAVSQMPGRGAAPPLRQASPVRVLRSGRWCWPGSSAAGVALGSSPPGK